MASFKTIVLKPGQTANVNENVFDSPDQAWYWLQTKSSSFSSSSSSSPASAEKLPLQQSLHQDASESIYYVVLDAVKDCQRYYSQFGFMDNVTDKSIFNLSKAWLKGIRIASHPLVLQMVHKTDD